MAKQTNDKEALADDLIWGAKDIGRAIGRNERQTWVLLDTGKIPSAKVGARYVASREKLRAHFEKAMRD